MTRTYKISGMTCNNCKASVLSALLAIPNVGDVSINLEKAEATLKLKTPIGVSELQNALPEKYRISEVGVDHNLTSENEINKSQQTELKQLFPLFLIFGYITITAVLLNNNPWNTEAFMLDFMGLFYIVFSFFKLLDLKGFSQSFKMYDPLAKVMPLYRHTYPFIEVALGLAFLFRFQIEKALILTLLILGITTIGVTRVLRKKTKIQCACLGTALKLPMTKATFIENSIMIVMAIVMLLKLYL
ncbi:heavy-metal-associated domain-containing protein [Winogradskyella immobilis]|uniref:Cation transporter n=1 Tax=Winogradskyella immobilis TaxID=2816852 RepID=A0ABS8ELU3_9FLAO|nr:heavy-metal-associated domain-containing protein [Winogradskyella immobilis]MCC1483996.1 cation transporter [Winogradskyella immobilis]MCG0016088.1 cation transporter [Winogradskyella immobilis]